MRAGGWERGRRWSDGGIESGREMERLRCREIERWRYREWEVCVRKTDDSRKQMTQEDGMICTDKEQVGGIICPLPISRHLDAPVSHSPHQHPITRQEL